jgi:hypothetical protein
MSAPQMQTTGDLYRCICDERGGEQALSHVQRRIAVALSHSLRDPAAIDAGLVARLVDQLPPITVPHGETHEDLSRLDDAELDALEALLSKAIAPGAPEPDALVRALNEANASVEHVQSIANEAIRLRGIAQQSELTQARLEQSARAECERWRAEVDRLQLQLSKIAAASVANATPSEQSDQSSVVAKAALSNVIPLEGPFAGIARVNSGWR